MGDKQDRDRWRSSLEYAANRTRCKEWNRLMKEIKDLRWVWTVTEIRWLVTQRMSMRHEDHECSRTQLDRLRKLVAGTKNE